MAAGLGACAPGANTVGGIWAVLAPLAGERAGITEEGLEEGLEERPEEEPEEALEDGAVSTSDSDP